jgi:hypothetical protein
LGYAVSAREHRNTCGGCGNTKAVKTIYVYGKGESCDKCGGFSVVLGIEKKTGFMYKDKVLKQNRHTKLRRQGRTEYRGDSHDEVRGRDT